VLALTILCGGIYSTCMSETTCCDEEKDSPAKLMGAVSHCFRQINVIRLDSLNWNVCVGILMGWSIFHMYDAYAGNTSGVKLKRTR